MPTISRPCRNRGCPNAQPCDAHPIDRNQNRVKKPSDAFYGSAQWQKARSAYRNRHPLCERCEREGRVKIADMVHHIKPTDTHPELKTDWNNLESLCRDCHEQIEGRKV